MTQENNFDYEAKQVLNVLKKLRAFSPENKTQLDEWYVIADELAKLLYQKGDLTINLPSFLWHYYSDADMRMKYDWYAKQQNETVDKFITALEGGTLLTNQDL